MWVQDNNTGIWHISAFVYPLSANTMCGLSGISTFIATFVDPTIKFKKATLCSKCKVLSSLQNLLDNKDINHDKTI